jgi:hypothetical protein
LSLKCLPYLLMFSFGVAATVLFRVISKVRVDTMKSCHIIYVSQFHIISAVLYNQCSSFPHIVSILLFPSCSVYYSGATTTKCFPCFLLICYFLTTI